MVLRVNSHPPHEKPSGGIYVDTNQLDLVSGAWTLVDLDTKQANFNDGIEDLANKRLVPGQAGIYSIYAQIGFTSIVVDKSYGFKVRVSGVGPIFTTIHHSSWVDDLWLSWSGIWYLTSTDYLDVVAWHNAGVDTVDLLMNSFLQCQRER